MRIQGLHARGPTTFCVCETKSGFVTWSCIKPGPSDVELAMNSRIDNSFELIDHKTCRSICDAVGERLQQSMPPVKSELPPHLARLMDRLRERDDNGGTMMH